MAENITNENAIKNEKNNAKENEIKNVATDKNTISEYDAFAYAREREENLDYQREEDTVVYATPLDVQRLAGGKSDDGERTYYNYAVGYMVKINGKEIPQTINLAPTEKRADIYDLLDAIFGESDRVKLCIVRASRTQTVNGTQRTSYTYSPLVSAADEDGVEFSCNLAAVGNGGRVKFNNLVKKFKSVGVIE